MINIFPRKGFTLIELLLILVIVAVLASLLFIVYKNVQDKASGAKCLHQIRILTQVAGQWSADNDGVLLAKADDGRGWPTLIEPYLPTSLRDFACPAFKKAHPVRDARAMGYGRNRYFHNNDGKVDSVVVPRGRVLQITNPVTTIAFYENDSFLGGDLWGGYVGGVGGGIYYYLYPAHNDGFNVSFFDGHAEWMKLNSLGSREGHSAADYPQYIWKPY